jgi:diguanylate cyclase (GGDEF)-like protein
MFIESEGYLKAHYEDKDWIEYLQISKEKVHKAKIKNLHKEVRIFELKVEYIKSSKKYFILFRDITNEEKSRRKLEERANLDSLTQIKNRDRFEYYLEKTIGNAHTTDKAFSLIMFDIDHFKKINDSYGHDIGDIVLKELAKLVTAQIRDEDIFARWGGEEFMIITATDIYAAEMFAEKLRHSLEEHNFEQVKRVTCSFGITEYRKSDTMESIVKRCDTMLYSAKEAGRNCVAAIK